jgi:hypothetical protein
MAELKANTGNIMCERKLVSGGGTEITEDGGFQDSCAIYFRLSFNGKKDTS